KIGHHSSPKKDMRPAGIRPPTRRETTRGERVAKAKSTSARAQGKRAAVTTKKRATAHAKRNGAGNVDAVGDRLNGHAARALDGAPPTLTAQDFARIERALERCARLTEDVDSFRQIIHDCMAIEYFDTALRVAENVERWWA